MAGTLRLEIVTPEGTVYSEDVEMVTLPSIAGQMGIYPKHVPLIAQMVPGEMIVRKPAELSLLLQLKRSIQLAGDPVIGQCIDELALKMATLKPGDPRRMEVFDEIIRLNKLSE